MSRVETLGYKIELVDLEEVKSFPKQFDQFQSEFSDDRLREHAAEDAKSNLPHSDIDAPSPFEREVHHGAQQLASKISSAFKRALEQVDAKIKAERELVEAKYKNTLELIEETYKAEKDGAENAYGLKALHKRLEGVEKQREDIYSRVKRGPVVYIPHWLYLVLAVAIFLGEVPLNALVFQIFGENQVMTWVMALVIGLCVPVSAHFIGVKFREHGEGISWSNLAKGTIALAVVVAALYALSVMRHDYLETFKDTLGLSDSLVKTSFLFFWLNVAVLSAAITISYLAHDGIPGYDNLQKELKTLERQIGKAENEKVSRLKRAAMQRVKAKDDAATEQRDDLNRVALMKGTYDQLLREGQEWESRAQTVLRQMLSVYRQTNIRMREDKAMPASFRSEPDLELELKKMKEKLDNEAH